MSATQPVAYSTQARRAPRRFLRFLAIGVLNSAFGYGVFAALVLFGLAHGLALAAATVIGVGFNFVTTGRLVFDNRDRWLLPRYIGVYAAQFMLNLWALKLLAAAMPALIAQLLLVGPMAIVTYFLMSRFVFGRGAEMRVKGRGDD